MTSMLKRSTAALVAVVAFAAMGCQGPEQELVDRFFEASQRGDNASVAALSMVAFPEEVESWNVLAVGEEARTPYLVPRLIEQVGVVEDERDVQFKVFGEWRRSNYETLRNIQARLRDDPDYHFPGRLGELQDQWDVYREERLEVVAKLRDAELELEREIRRVNKSLQRESTPEFLTGETQKKPVTVRVTTPAGDRHYEVTLTRYDLKNQFDATVPTRWIITALAPVD